MEVGAVFIGVVKTNIKVFCKDNIDNLTKDQLEGSYLVLSNKPMVHMGRPLISVGYKYNIRKFFPFIGT